MKYLSFIYIYIYIYGVSQLLKQSNGLSDLSVAFILILLSDYNWKIVYILIYLTKHCKIMPWMMKQKIFCVKTYYKTKSFQMVHEIYTRKFNFYISPNRSQIFKLVKNFEAHGTCEDHRAMGSHPPWSNVHTLSTTFHIAFNSALDWIANIWSTYLRVLLEIFDSYLRLHGYRS